MTKIKQWLKYRRVFNLVSRAARNAFHMQQWGRAHNLYDRLDRVLGNPPQFRLRHYLSFKQSLVNALGWDGKWPFNPYTLS